MKNSMVHISVGSGKMNGINSINTSQIGNEFCQEKSRNSKNVCSSCYAHRFEKTRRALHNKLVENSKVLSEHVLEEDELPDLSNFRIFRFHSFGELINKKHYQNLINIARKNPNTMFGLWTKRHVLIRTLPREENISYVYSSLRKNRPSPMTSKMKDFFNHRFTVFTASFLNSKSRDIRINCSGKQCQTCRLCYQKDTEFEIREKLK